jgi:Leucine-rich repeat (LRR) protein
MKTVIQLSLIGFSALFFGMCTNDPGPEPPVIGKPSYCSSYNLLSTQASTAVSLNIWCLCEGEDFDLATETQRFINVESIDFRGTTFAELPVFPTLQILKIESTVELPDAISNHTSITQLTLQGEGISRLPSSIDALINLKQLRVYSKNFFSIPASFENLPLLEFIEFRSNSIFNVPDVFGGLVSLKELIFVDNPVKEFPPEFLRNQNIERITVNNIQLEDFPEGLDTLQNLLRFSMKNDVSLVSIENANNLNIVPTRVGDLIGLEQLNLSNLNIDQLPPDIQNLAGTLRWLYLENCPVTNATKANLEIWLPDTEIFY